MNARISIGIALAVVASACSGAGAHEPAPDHTAAELDAAVASAATPAPVWEDLPFAVTGCTVQRLANADELRLLQWRSCAELDGCREAVFDDAIIGADGEIGRRTVVVDDGREIHIGVRYDSDDAEQAGVVVAREDGSIALALRVSTAKMCSINIPSVAHGRFSVLVSHAQPGALARKGGLLAALDRLDALTPFELDPLPSGSGPDEVAMGPSRWLWRLVPDRLLTFSNVDGSDATVFAEQSSTILSMGRPAALGSSFVFDMTERAADGSVASFIARSDGTGAPERFVDGRDGRVITSAMPAHSHLAWLERTAPTEPDGAPTLELWASPLGDDDTEPVPQRIGELDPGSWSAGAAGWGRYVTLSAAKSAVLRELEVWQLDGGTRRTIALPEDRHVDATAGVTRSELWIVPGFASSKRRGLMRIAL